MSYRKVYSSYRARPRENHPSVAVKPTLNVAWGESVVGDVDGVNATFTLQHQPNLEYDVLVFLDGIFQIPDEGYTLEGKTLSFSTPPAKDSNISAYYRYF